MLYTDDAEAIHQVTSKREAFPKDTSSYSLLAQYGQNVLTTEGQLWRMHRKITSVTEIHRWMVNFNEDQQNAHSEVLSSILKLDNKTEIVIEVLATLQAKNQKFIDEVMNKMQCVSTVLGLMII